MHKTIAIIIPVHNSLAYTKKCLAGLEDLTAKAASDAWGFEVVVVDDGSDDGTAQWVRAHHPAVHLCFGDGSLWWSGGINKGMQYALEELNADYILWWNNDVFPADDYFIQLVALLQDGDQKTVYGSKVYHAGEPTICNTGEPTIYNADEHSICNTGEHSICNVDEHSICNVDEPTIYNTDESCIKEEQHHNAGIHSKGYTSERSDVVWAYGGYFHRRWGYSFLCGKGEPDGKRFQEAVDADWLPGMGTVFPARLVTDIGWVNAGDFPQYHADIDYTCRARQAGYRVVVEPRLRLWNHTGHSGRSHEGRLGRLLPALHDIKSPDHFRKEWLLYRKHAPTPLAYLMVIKKYLGYFGKFFIKKVFFLKKSLVY